MVLRRSARHKANTSGSGSSSSSFSSSRKNISRATKHSPRQQTARRRSKRLSKEEVSSSSSSESDSSDSESEDELVPSNLFEVELTEAQKKIINTNILKQQEMLKAYEKREKDRTVKDLVEMMQCTEEEAKTALQQTKGNYDKAINKLIILKRKQGREERRLACVGRSSRRKSDAQILETVSLPESAIVNEKQEEQESRASRSKRLKLQNLMKKKARVVIPEMKDIKKMTEVLKKATAKKQVRRLGRVTHKATKKCELVEIGKIDTRLRFSNSGYIFPVGYKSYINYISSKDPTKHCRHLCEIIAPEVTGGKNSKEWQNARPIFRITADDRKDEPLEGFSATKPWKLILERINVGRRKKKWKKSKPPLLVLNTLV